LRIKLGDLKIFIDSPDAMMQTKFFSQISLQLTPLPEHTLLFQIHQCYFPLPRNVIFSHSFIFSQARDTPSLAFGGVGGWT
jgi:hypothetical protein